MPFLARDRLRGPPSRVAARSARATGPRGQALVEFAIVLVPLLILLVGVIQFGFLFGANVTLTNATREGARAGTIYVYNQNHTKAWNDAARCGAIVTAARNAFGMLDPTAPHFTVTVSGGSCPMPSGDSQTNGDLQVSYCSRVNATSDPCPNPGDSTTTCAPDTREGCLLRLSLTYHSDVVLPFMGAFLSTDSYGRFVQRVTATMVVN